MIIFTKFCKDRTKNLDLLLMVNFWTWLIFIDSDFTTLIRIYWVWNIVMGGHAVFYHWRHDRYATTPDFLNCNLIDNWVQNASRVGRGLTYLFWTIKYGANKTHTSLVAFTYPAAGFFSIPFSAIFFFTIPIKISPNIVRTYLKPIKCQNLTAISKVWVKKIHTHSKIGH